MENWIQLFAVTSTRLGQFILGVLLGGLLTNNGNDLDD